MSLFGWQRKRVCFSNDIQTVEIPRRRASNSLLSSSPAPAADEGHCRSLKPTLRPVNRQLELSANQVKSQLEPGQQVKGRLRSPLTGTGANRVSEAYNMTYLTYTVSLPVDHSPRGS